MIKNRREVDARELEAFKAAMREKVIKPMHERKVREHYAIARARRWFIRSPTAIAALAIAASLFAPVSFGHGVHQPPPPAPAPAPAAPEPVITHDSHHHSRAAAAAIVTGILVYYLTKESKGMEFKIKSQPGDDR